MNEEIIKSLAEELELSEDEIRDLIKAEEEPEEKEKEKPGEEEDDDDDPDDEVTDEELQKSLTETLREMKKRNLIKVSDPIQKSETETDLIKGDDLLKALRLMNEQIEDRFDSIEESLEKIGSEPQGLKGARFDFLEKAGDMAPFEKDGKKFISSRDRNGISEAMLDVIQKSDDDDFKQSVGADLINYQGSGEISKRAISNLNRGGYFFKEQLK